MLLLAQQVQLLLDCVAIATAAAAAAATGRRLPVVDRANAADDRGRDLGFGITFCSYDCTVILLLLLQLSLMVVNATSSTLLLLVITGRPADLRCRWPLLVLRRAGGGMSPKRTSGPVASAATTTATGAAAATAVCGLLGLGC